MISTFPTFLLPLIDLAQEAKPKPKMPKLITNPFKHDIDLTSDAWIKNYKTATKGLEPGCRFDSSTGQVRAFRTAVEKAASSYSWGVICTSIEHAKANGAVPEKLNLLFDFSTLTLADMERSAATTWGSAVKDDKKLIDTDETDKVKMQRRLCSVMMSKWITNLITDTALEALSVKGPTYRFFDKDDGEYE